MDLRRTCTIWRSVSPMQTSCEGRSQHLSRLRARFAVGIPWSLVDLTEQGAQAANAELCHNRVDRLHCGQCFSIKFEGFLVYVLRPPLTRQGSSTAALLRRVLGRTTRVRSPQTYARRSASVSADLGPWFRRWQRWQEPNGRGRSTKLRSLKFQRRRMLTAKFSSVRALEADATTKEAAFEKD